MISISKAERITTPWRGWKTFMQELFGYYKGVTKTKTKYSIQFRCKKTGKLHRENAPAFIYVLPKIKDENGDGFYLAHTINQGKKISVVGVLSSTRLYQTYSREMGEDGFNPESFEGIENDFDFIENFEEAPKTTVRCSLNPQKHTMYDNVEVDTSKPLFP